MNGNIVRLLEISFSIFVFMLAIFLTVNIHDQLSYVLEEVQKGVEEERIAYQSRTKGVNLKFQDSHFSDENAIRRLIANEIVLLNKTEAVDSDYLKTDDKPEFPKLWLDFMNCYLHDLSVIPEIPKGGYEILYVSDVNGKIIEIRVMKE